MVELIVDNKQRLLTPGDYALATFALPQNKHSFRVPAAVLMRDKGLKAEASQADVENAQLSLPLYWLPPSKPPHG